jgi:hypothetical protein
MTARTATAPTEQVDEHSERWVTAIHEAGHVTAVEALGYRVRSAHVDNDDDRRGGTDHTVPTNSLDRAVVAVAGERATRLLLGTGGGSQIDYDQARYALGQGRLPIEWAEDRADEVIRLHRRDLLHTARRLYRGRS